MLNICRETNWKKLSQNPSSIVNLKKTIANAIVSKDVHNSAQGFKEG